MLTKKANGVRLQLFAVVFAVPMVKNAVMLTKKANGARL
jgi:hypothetical protein